MLSSRLAKQICTPFLEMNASFKEKVTLYDCSIRQEIDISFLLS